MQAQERQAFLEPYKHFKPFKDAAGGLNLEEFADAKEVVQVRLCSNVQQWCTRPLMRVCFIDVCLA